MSPALNRWSRPQCRFTALFLVAAFAGSSAGCTDPNPLGRLPITGSVMLYGEPLDGGSIGFQSTGSGPALSSGATIYNGQFAIEEEQGLPPGRYLVTISAPGDERVPWDGEPEAEERLSVELVPAEWNVESKHTVVVEAGARNRFEFEIE